MLLSLMQTNVHAMLFLTPNMTGRRFHCTMEVIPALPWKSISPSVSRLCIPSSRCEGFKRGTTRNFLHLFPLSGTPVVQSCWAWIFENIKLLGAQGNPGKFPGISRQKVFPWASIRSRLTFLWFVLPGPLLIRGTCRTF